MLIEIEIEGITPLIQNCFTDEAAQGATAGTPVVSAGDRGTPLEQAAERLYIGHDEKTPMVPSPNLFSCLVEAGKFHKLGKVKITTQKTSLIPAAMMILGIELELKSREGWAVDTRPVRIPATGGRILRHRPIWNDWHIPFTIDLDTGFFPLKLCRQIVDDAGKRIGLGDFRPSCKGVFGRFVVTSWAENKE